MRLTTHSLILAYLVGSLIGCASSPEVKQQAKTVGETPVVQSNNQTVNDQPINLNTERYTVVSTEPVPEQLQLVKQIVDIRIPTRMAATIKDGMTYLLSRTGYSLCDGDESADVEHLYRLPLPAVHYQIGPTTLIRALQVLAGQTYEVRVNEVNRTVCFTLRDEFQKGATQ